MKLAEELIMLRREHNITQAELAEALDVSRQAISKWERGSAVPSTEKLIALSRLYDVPVERLVDGNLEFQKKPAAAVEGVTPVDEEALGKRMLKIAADAGLAACLLLVTIASVITIWSAVFKKPEEPKDKIIRTDDIIPEYIDPSEVLDRSDFWDVIEE